MVIPCIGIVGASFWAWKNVEPMAGCAISYSHLDDALKSYAEKHDGKLPPAAKWQDELRPFYKEQTKINETPFQAFAPDGDWFCTTGSKKTGIAMNSDVDGKKRTDLKASEVILFEVSEVGSNLHMKYVDRAKSSSPKIFGSPRGWLKITASGFSDSDSGF